MRYFALLSMTELSALTLTLSHKGAREYKVIRTRFTPSVRKFAYAQYDVFEIQCPPLAGGGFADGRRETNPDSEKIERIDTCCRKRNFSSVEQIQDRPKSLISRRGGECLYPSPVTSCHPTPRWGEGLDIRTPLSDLPF